MSDVIDFVEEKLKRLLPKEFDSVQGSKGEDLSDYEKETPEEYAARMHSMMHFMQERFSQYEYDVKNLVYFIERTTPCPEAREFLLKWYPQEVFKGENNRPEI